MTDSSNLPTSISGLKYDHNGLIPAIAQDAVTGDVRMVAWMNAEALSVTLSSGKATFYSRSQKKLWTKGETSGNFLLVRGLYADCDRDTLLLRVSPLGPSCHTGRPTCFFQRIDAETNDARPPATYLHALESEIALREGSSGEHSYTKSLLDKGAPKISEKIWEEAGEFTEALGAETEERVASEAADLLYHLMVGLRLRGVSLDQVMEVLASRAHQSGHAEKASRTTRS